VGLDTLGLAGRNRVVELFLVQIDQCQFRAFAGEILGHGTAQTLATASDNDYFVVELHAHAPIAGLSGFVGDARSVPVWPDCT
jgi:hypothetical protein